MTSAVKPPSTLIRQVHVAGPKFINDEILLDDWLARFYPKQMNVCHKAIEQARKQLLGI